MATNDTFDFKAGADIFSPKDLIQLGRPGAGVANSAGDLAFVSYSQYSFEEKKNSKALYVVPLTQPGITPLKISLPNGGEAFWLDGRTLGHVVENDGKLDLLAVEVQFNGNATQAAVTSGSKEPLRLGSFPTTTATNFVFSAQDGQLVFSDNVYEDGKLETIKSQDEAWENRGTTALVYDETYERHWDTWAGPKTTKLFSVSLVQDPDHQWHFGDKFVNLLEGTKHASPVEPFGGTDDFGVAHGKVIYTTKDAELPLAWHTKQDVYIVNVDGGNRKELTGGEHGAVHSPVLSPDGKKAAWLQLDLDGYESDRAKIVIYDLEKDIRYTLTQAWDRSPDTLAFGKSGSDFLYFTAGDEARIKTFVLPIPPTPESSTTTPDLAAKYTTPVTLTSGPAAGGLQTLSNGRILVSQSSLTSPNDIYLISGLKGLEKTIQQNNDPVTFNGNATQFTQLTKDQLAGKNLSPGENIWFKGANDRDVQGWIVKPPGFKSGEEKKWPIVLLIHGGPQGAWEDQWSTRWNPNVFAQQGYFVVAINPTGSTTFGQDFVDGITQDWGGKPFVDLQAGWKYVLDSYPEVDADRAVAAGASWGGYAINWIQGHPELGFNFKALVCHDGVFDARYNGFSTDELFFFNHDHGGRPWDPAAKEDLAKFDPSNFVDKWGTPQLIFHGSKDFRLPETEGIGAFHVLQQLGIPSRLVIFPDENHWVQNQGNSLKWHYEIFRWFDKYVGQKQ
ncbi:alpha/beta-hydrolase [Cylindrobasidium torrendii FP15055 ss-10]|uniref:Dipeptidyl-peptidase V n=1 Tax=Cylindrobasidium torrendii FP15055 ss-10 TaxID=1314674 RepID=A0A0D7BLX6_9AGAR|nr:alpha/beta-hydrolase [Cylindrobasidium torrendii FP15055 ss-10]